jgi:hypothetical protein
MTSFRQIEANRRNTLFRAEDGEGEARPRRSKLRHGLTEETAIDGLEDSEDYRAFEAAIIANYDARTSVERELVCGGPRCSAASGESFRLRPGSSRFNLTSSVNAGPFFASHHPMERRMYVQPRILPIAIRDLTFCFPQQC